jgi:DNA invertase Pin-like site-specific DNA recombinase
MSKHNAIYMRVSSKAQDLKSQASDLQRYADACPDPVAWYSEKFTGKRMERPG